MCGIAGLLALDGSVVSAERLERMARMLDHRGPDDRGARVVGACGLAHRRLSIIDLSPEARQPLADESGDTWVVANGEIYNHETLREELLRAGHRFRSRSDSEVLVHLAESGAAPERVLERLDGMFAFAAWDAARGRLLLARDRLGIKPLYWARAGGALLFASEPKAILASGLIEARPDPAAIASYLAYRHAIAPRTMYEGIHALEPGHYLLAEDGRVTVRRYWDIPDPRGRPDLGAAHYEVGSRRLLSEAVRKRLMSDVPLGAYLSGGLDSSIVVALMAEQSSGPVRTYAVGFGDDGVDEFPFARLVAQRYATDHHEVRLDAPRYFELLPELIRLRDAPLGVPNEVPLFEMSRVLKQDITVVLSGEGSDELFAGYGDYVRIPFDWRKGQVLARLPGLLRGPLGGGIASKYGEAVSEPDPVAHFFAGYGWFKPVEIAGLLAPGVARAAGAAGRDAFADHFEATRGWDPYARVLYALEKVHLVNLLARVDSMTMATAVEARVPFVDQHLVEFATAIPLRYKLRWRSPFHRARAWLSYSDRFRERDDVTKAILRETFRADLPREVLRRRKVGFKVPLERAFGGRLMDVARGVLLSEEARRRGLLDVEAVRRFLDGGGAPGVEFGLRAWMLVNLELWARIALDGERPDIERLAALGASR